MREMQEPVKEIRNGKRLLRIYPDTSGDSPRDWDNLGHMVCWHGRYTLGDKHSFKTPDDFTQFVKEQGKDIVLLPLYLLDHSGLRIRTRSFSDCDPGQWDSGQVGWIYATSEDAKKAWGCKDNEVVGLTAENITKIREVLQEEVEVFDQFLSGDVYGFQVVEEETCATCGHTEERHIDSCWGFYGDDWEKNGLLDHAGEEWTKAMLEVA